MLPSTRSLARRRWFVAASAALHGALALLVLVLWSAEQTPEPEPTLAARYEIVEPHPDVAVDDEPETLEPIEPLAPPEFDAPAAVAEDPPALEPVEEPQAPEPRPSLLALPRFERVERRPPSAPAPETPAESPAVERPPDPPAARPAPPRRRAAIRPRFRPDPQAYYPYEARIRGVEGRVVVRVAFGTSGRVIQAAIARSSGSPLLDRAALRYAYDYRVDPLPGVQSADLPVTFVLDG